MKHCQRCGAAAEDHVRFCNVCGSAFFEQRCAYNGAQCNENEGGSAQINSAKILSVPPNAVSINRQRENAEIYEQKEKPVNVCGVLGFVFSAFAFVCEMIFIVCAVSFIADNPELLQTRVWDFSDAEKLNTYILLGVLLILLFLFTIFSLILSSIGAVHRLRCRLNGFAYVGLFVSCFCFSVLVIGLGIGL